MTLAGIGDRRDPPRRATAGLQTGSVGYDTRFASNPRGIRRGVMVTDLLPSADATTPTPHEASAGSESTREVQRTRLVVDTSVLIADPTCVLEFVDADVIVPLTVVEELDGLKGRPDDSGRSARTALRTLEELRVAHGGSLAEPVPTGNGTSTLQIEINNIRKHLLVEHGLDPSVPDNRIIGAAIGQSDFGPTTIISNDAALRIKAAHLGVDAAEHRRTRSDRARPAAGWTTLEAPYEAIDCVHAARSSASLSNSCSTRTSPWSPSTDAPARERPSWRSPPGSNTSSNGTATNVSPCTGRWCRSDERTSASSPVASTRSSTHGWLRFMTRWWRCPIAATSTTPGQWSTS